MAFLFFERCRSYSYLHKRPCFLFETVKLKDLLTGRLLLRDWSRLITAGPGHVIRKLIKVYLKLLISPWKVLSKILHQEIIAYQTVEGKVIVVLWFFGSYQQCIPACCKHAKEMGQTL